MSFDRIHITGASGSGTTTLARALGERLKYAVLDADDYFWLETDPPFQRKRERPERLALLLRDFEAHPASIVSGSIVHWGDEIERAFDLIIYLWLPTDLRIERLRKREIEKHGRADEEFLAWARRYDTADTSMRSKALHERWLADTRCPVLRLEGDLRVEERVEQALHFMSGNMA